MIALVDQLLLTKLLFAGNSLSLPSQLNTGSLHWIFAFDLRLLAGSPRLLCKVLQTIWVGLDL